MTAARSMLLIALALTTACSDNADTSSNNSIVVRGQSSVQPLQPAPQETRGQDFVSSVLGSFDFSEASVRFAVERGEPAKVKLYAQKLGADLAAARTELLAIAQAGRLQPLPVAGPTHQTDLAILSSSRGQPLAKAFAEQQMEALTLLVGTMRAYKNGGDNPRLQEWAAKHQAPLNDRLLDAQTLNAELEEASLPADQR